MRFISTKTGLFEVFNDYKYNFIFHICGGKKTLQSDLINSIRKKY